jgi:hypothetical protein
MRNHHNKKIDLDRAKKLIKTMDTEKAEYKKEEAPKREIDKEKASKEVARNMKLSNLMEYNYTMNNPTKPQGFNSKLGGGVFGGFSHNGNEFAISSNGTLGNTVTTFVKDDINPELAKRWGAKYALKPSEAIIVAVKRTLESGAPVNNIGFYDEINWFLNNMGFDAKNPLDIKQAILKIIEDKL